MPHRAKVDNVRSNRIMAASRLKMGIEYYIINKENRSFYDLGKGGWYVLGDDKEYLTDAEYLEEFIFDDVFHLYEKNIASLTDMNREYCKWLAQELYDFCKYANLKNILIRSDAGDDTIVFRALKYECFGTRYTGTENHPRQKMIDFENRHLVSKTESHIYDIDKIRKQLPLLVEEYEKVWVDDIKKIQIYPKYGE